MLPPIADIVTSGGPQSIRVTECALSLELLLAFIQDEDEETRIIVLKLLDVFLRNQATRNHFLDTKLLLLLIHF